MSTLELVSQKAQELIELEKVIEEKQAELKEIQNNDKFSTSFIEFNILKI